MPIYRRRTHEPPKLPVLCLPPERFPPRDQWDCPFGILGAALADTCYGAWARARARLFCTPQDSPECRDAGSLNLRVSSARSASRCRLAPSVSAWKRPLPCIPGRSTYALPHCTVSPDRSQSPVSRLPFPSPRSNCYRPLRFSRGLSRPENAFGGHKKACCEVSIETSKVSGARTLAPAPSPGDPSFSCGRGDPHVKAQHDGPNQLKAASDLVIRCLDRSAGHLNGQNDKALSFPGSECHLSPSVPTALAETDPPWS